MSEIKEDLGLIAVAVGVIAIIVGFLYLGTLFAKEEIVPQHTETIEYNGFTFEKQSKVWFTLVEINNVSIELIFYFNPTEVEDIPIRKNIDQVLMGAKKVYITLSPEDSTRGNVGIAAIEVSKILGKIFQIDVSATLTEGEDQGYPVATCDDITKESRVIMLQISNETNVKLDNGCIIVSGKNESEIIRAADRLDYALLHIIEDK